MTENAKVCIPDKVITERELIFAVFRYISNDGRRSDTAVR